MKKISLTLLAWLAFVVPVYSANIDIPGLPAASSVTGTDLYECSQGGTSRKCTAAQIAAYVYGLTSGDATINGTGGVTLANVNSNVGTFGSATQCITTTQNAKGLTTAISAATCTPAVGSITGFGTGVAAALAASLNGSTGMVGGLTPTSGNCIIGNGSAWTSTACSNIVTSAIPSTQTGTNYAIVDGDRGKVIYLSNATNQTPTLPSAATLTNSNGWFVTLCNINAGTQTVTPTTSTIGGASTLLIPAGNAARPVCQNVISDGTNYLLVPSSGTIFNGTATLGTSAITAGSCATAVNVTTPGVVSADVATVGFSADPTATTGYLPTAMLTIVPWTATNQVSIKVCNLTGSPITPSSVTINVRVSR